MSKKWKELMERAATLAAEGAHLEAEKIYLDAVGAVERNQKNQNLLAETLQKLGLLMTVIGSFDEAEGYLLRALAIRKELHGELHEEVADTLTALGRIYAPYESEESEKLLRKAISIYQELGEPSIVFPAEHLSTLFLLRGKREERRQLLAELVSRMENGVENKPLLGKSLFMLAQFHEEDDESESECLAERAVPLLCGDVKFAQSAAEAAMLLGKLQMRKQNFVAAQQNFGLAIEQAILTPQTSAHTQVEALTRLARLKAIAAKNYKGAETHLAEATLICRSQVPPLPMHNVILEYEKLCEFTNEYESLEKLRRESLDAFKSIIDESRDRCQADERSAYASAEAVNLSRLLRRLGRLDEAADFAKYAVETDERVTSPKLVGSLLELAAVRFEQQRLEEANELCTRVMQLKFDGNWYFPQLADALRLTILLGRDQDARHLRNVANGFMQRFTSNCEWSKGLCHRLALVYLEVGSKTEADQLLERALRAAEQAEPVNTLFFAHLLESWAAQFRLIGDVDLSFEYDLRAQTIRDRLRVSASLPSAR